MKLWPCLHFPACGWDCVRWKAPAEKVVNSLLSWHGSHYWFCITFCKVQHNDSVTKVQYYYFCYCFCCFTIFSVDWLWIPELTIGISSLGGASSTRSHIPYRLSSLRSSASWFSRKSSSSPCSCVLVRSSPISTIRFSSRGCASFSKLMQQKNCWSW